MACVLAPTDTAIGKEPDLPVFPTSNGSPEIVELLKNPPPVLRKPRKP